MFHLKALVIIIIIIIIMIIIIIIIIITLFKEDIIFGRVASLTYGPQLTIVGMVLYK